MSLLIHFIKNLSAVALLILIGAPVVSAQNMDVTRLNKAKTWNLARKACKDLGPEWDLPKADQLDLALSKELFTEFLNYVNGNSEAEKDLVLWVRSPQEEYNSQLVNTSKALRYNSKTKEISEIDFSESAMNSLRVFYGQLQSLPKEALRTNEEQKLFEQAVALFKKLYPMAQVEFDMYEPYEASFPLLPYLPQNIFTQQIIMIMFKINPEAVLTMQKNIDYIMANFSDGIPVTCLKDSRQWNVP